MRRPCRAKATDSFVEVLIEGVEGKGLMKREAGSIFGFEASYDWNRQRSSSCKWDDWLLLVSSLQSETIQQERVFRSI